MTPLLPYAFARDQGVIARRGTSGIEIDLSPVAALTGPAEMIRLFGTDLRVQHLQASEFARALELAYRDNTSDAAAAAGGDLVALADSAAALDDLLDKSDDAPVVRLINALLTEAIREGASDIHIEPQERRLVVRFRIDGMLREVLEPRRTLAPFLVSRIKIMAALDIAERRLPQDGRVSLRLGGSEVDVRVSTLPSQFGERVVLRLLDRSATRMSLAQLGMAPQDAETFARLLQRPDGMFLVTGPTGSGKTTTLYAALDRMNDKSRNIITIEDPIEYTLEGVGQIQVNPRADLTFARGLRAILRQDPDVIMVGEIRDRETAEVATEAAMTGHFVLSTLHTNTAIGAVTRLVDMGVERFVLAPMLTGLLAQRLVRRLCPECRSAAPVSQTEAAWAQGLIASGETAFHPKGCPACQGIGYRGRAAIYELIPVTQTLQAMIQASAPEAELEAEARRHGPSLLGDGMRLVRSGVTSLAEVLRVAREE